MKKPVYYHNPRCSKSRQGLALLSEHGQEIEIKEYLKEGVTLEEAKSLLEKKKDDLFLMIRTKEQEFKDSGLKVKDMSLDKMIHLIHKFPKVLERPLLVTKKSVIIGRPPENFLTLFS